MTSQHYNLAALERCNVYTARLAV